MGATPIEPKKAEGALRGKKIDAQTIKQAAQLASDESHPRSDLRGSAEFKKDLIRVLTARAINKALVRAQGGK